MRISLLAALTAFTLTLGCPNTEQGFCGDGVCRPSESESSTTCAMDCMAASCGDGACSPGNGESCTNCPSDCGGCGAQCGNGVCASSESCSSCPGDCGMCSTTCGPTTCAGCCSGNTCLGGAATTACGEGGRLCLDCGPGSLCQGSACVVDPASRWNLFIDGYEVAGNSYTGATWDTAGGSPDPVVSAFAPNESTSIGSVNGPDDSYAMSTFSPAQMLATNVRADTLMTYLEMRMLDEDAKSYERIGSCNVTDTVTLAFGGSTITTRCPLDLATMNSGFVLRWHLERF